MVLVIESVDVGIEIEHAVWIGRAPQSCDHDAGITKQVKFKQF